jgi:hypothetical protein
MKILIPILTLSLFIISCKKKGCTNPGATNYNAEAQKDDGSCVFPETNYSSQLTVNPTFNSSSIEFDTIQYMHPLGYNMSISTLKFFMSDIVLYDQSGDSIVLNGGHYFDCKSGPGSVNLWTEEIPAGNYTGVGFYFGLNENYNVTGYYTNPPESLMEWPIPMGGGYHNMKFEGYYDSLGTTKAYNIHTGPLNGNPYHFKVVLNQSFSISDGDIDIDLRMNLENWLQQPTDFDFDFYGPAIMGNQAAQEIIKQNGYNVFTIENIQ